MSAVPKPKHRAQKKRFHARRDLRYAKWIRTQPCVLLGRWYFEPKGHYVIYHSCHGDRQACHVKSRGSSGADHRNLYSGCVTAHDSQHMLGIQTWQARWGVDLKAEAARLWTLYQDTVPPFQET